MSRLKKELKRALITSLGALFIILGILGFALPLINGTILFILGLLVLSIEYTTIDEKLTTWALKNRYIEKWHAKLRTLVRWVFREDN